MNQETLANIRRGILQCEECGTVSFSTFVSSATELLEKTFLDPVVNNSRFLLWVDEAGCMNFEHWNTKFGARRASVPVEQIFPSKVSIFLSWSKDEISISVGTGNGTMGLQRSSSSEVMSKVRKDKLGALHKIGDKNMEVFDYRVIVNGEEVLSPPARELWDFKIIKIDVLLEELQKFDNYLFKSIIFQQIIVMLTTGFEVYNKYRFIEMLGEGKFCDYIAIVNYLYPKDEDRVVVLEKIKNNGFEKFIFGNGDVRSSVDFQNWKKSSRVYKAGFDISFSEMGLNHQTITNLLKGIKLRHDIIHSKRSLEIVDYADSGEPIFLNQEYVVEMRDSFNDFVCALDEKTNHVA